MYRRPKFLEVLLEIRQEMAREADYDVDFFAAIVRNGARLPIKSKHSLADTEVEPNDKARSENPLKARRRRDPKIEER